MGVPRAMRGGMKKKCWSERPAQTEMRAWEVTDVEALVEFKFVTEPRPACPCSPNKLGQRLVANVNVSAGVLPMTLGSCVPQCGLWM